MYRKILLGGVAAAVILGAGGTALAVSGSDTAAPSPSSTTTQQGKHQSKHGKAGKLLRHLAHGQFVSTGKDGKAVTVDLIRGTVTSVSSSAITVQAADKVSETFAVDKDTKVREHTAGTKSDTGQRTKGTASKGTVADLAKGDHVLVMGTGTSKYVARHIVEIKK